MTTDEFSVFVNSLARQLSRPLLAEANPGTTLTELGLDSLAMLELLVTLDQLGLVRDDSLLDPAWVTTGLSQISLGELYQRFVVGSRP